MSIVGGLDIHRKQLTFDYLDQATGEVTSGRIAPADRGHLGGACTTHGGRLMAPSRGRDHAQRPGQRDRVGQRGGRAQREVVAGPRDDHDANVCLGGVEP